MDFLADIADASPQGIKDTLLVIGTLLGLAGGVLALLRKPQVFPQPVQTQEAERYATARGVESLAQQLTALRSDVSTLKVEFRDKLDEKISAVHGRLDPLVGRLEHMLGEWESSQNRRKS